MKKRERLELSGSALPKPHRLDQSGPARGWLIWLVLLAVPCFLAPAAVADRPEPSMLAQPSAVSVQHVSGQSFVTWQESTDLEGESYRVYRHTAPIDASNIAQAALLYQVPEGSSRFYSNRYRTYGTPAWKPRYLDRYVIVDHGQELDETTGLLVWTLGTEDFASAFSGTSYYAVTMVVSGTENLDVSGDNVAGPIQESVAAPSPVEIDAELPEGWHAFIQYMDLRHWNPTYHAPRGGNSYYGLEETDSPQVLEALQYAYDYAVYVPSLPPETLTATLPIVVSLHGWDNNAYGPPTPQTAPSWQAYHIRPIDSGETWWYGHARDYDYREGGRPAQGDTVINYTEYRVMRMVTDLMREPIGPTVDEERMYVYGYSMGAGGALAMSLRYPDVFAGAYASKPITNYRNAGGWKFSLEKLWGSDALNLPIENVAPIGIAQDLGAYDGTGVWDWQDHQANVSSFRGRDMVPIGIAQSLDDTNLPWSTQGEPLYAQLEASGQCWASSIRQDGHNWTAFAGLPAMFGLSELGVPFAGLQAVRSETVPGISVANPNSPIPPTDVCELNQHLLWSSSWQPWDGPPVDSPDYWRMSLCLADNDATGTSQTMTLAPRRLQRFEVAADQVYGWRNQWIGDGTIVASGVITPDSDGLITLEGIEVTTTGNRISIWRMGQTRVDLPMVMSP